MPPQTQARAQLCPGRAAASAHVGVDGCAGSRCAQLVALGRHLKLATMCIMSNYVDAMDGSPCGMAVRSDKRNALTKLTAPVAGTVQQLAIHTAGGVVTPAQVLLVLVPDDSSVTELTPGMNLSAEINIVSPIKKHLDESLKER